MQIDLPADLPDNSLVRSPKERWQAELEAAEPATSRGAFTEVDAAMQRAAGWRDLLHQVAKDYRAGFLTAL
jgi:hypothetical protein